MQNRVLQTLRRLAPRDIEFEGRRIIGLYLILNGITRIAFAPLVPLDYMTDRMYGASAVMIGILLFGTSFSSHYRYLSIRLVALAGAALTFAWAVDLGFRANAFWALILFGIVLFFEAIRP